ncbi:hypothetical protein B4135_1145 [Caldibacillus debilis]|uniref:Uncharacterized protein n=1 Tax=Caldibacillus debilis TaxID=301148 RepID=A0A150MEG4_9BACI|nr:hypothetical protein B4135_1145 [Caldibacillus debilis]
MFLLLFLLLLFIILMPIAEKIRDGGLCRRPDSKNAYRIFGVTIG